MLRTQYWLKAIRSASNRINTMGLTNAYHIQRIQRVLDRGDEPGHNIEAMLRTQYWHNTMGSAFLKINSMDLLKLAIFFPSTVIRKAKEWSFMYFTSSTCSLGCGKKTFCKLIFFPSYRKSWFFNNTQYNSLLLWASNLMKRTDDV